MKKFILSTVLVALVAVVSFSCKKDNTTNPPKPPVEEEVLGTYGGDKLKLTVDSTVGKNAAVAIAKNNGKLEVKLTNVVPGQADFTIRNAQFKTQEVKAYVGVVTGKDTSDAAGYIVDFTSTIDAQKMMVAKVTLTKVVKKPIEDVVPITGTYKGQLKVTINGTEQPAMEQRVYLNKGTSYDKSKAYSLFTIRKFSFSGVTIDSIKVDNMMLYQKGTSAVVDTTKVPITLPLGNVLVDLNGAVADKNMDLSMKIVVEGLDMQIGVKFTGTKVNENHEAKIEKILIDSPVVVNQVPTPVPTSAFFTVSDTTKADALTLTPMITLAEGSKMDSVVLKVNGTSQVIKVNEPVDFSKFTSADDKVVYYVGADDPNFKTTYSLTWKRVPRVYTFNKWIKDPEGSWVIPSGWSATNVAANLIKIMYANLYPKDEHGNPKPLPIIPTKDSSMARVASLMTKGKYIDLGFIKTTIPAITAGSLFLGTFAVDMENTLKSTKFGIPFTVSTFPTSVDVKWSYTHGATYYKTKDKSNPNPDPDKTLWEIVPGAIDSASMVMVVYEVKDYKETLDGTNLKTSDKIAAIAVKERSSTTMTSDNAVVKVIKPYDASKLYKVAIVISSSAKGDLFMGGEDSELFVESVQMNY